VPPEVLLFCGIANQRLKKEVEAERSYASFLAAVENRKEKKWQPLRTEAAMRLERLRQMPSAAEAPASAAIQSALAALEPVAAPAPMPGPKPPPPEVELLVLPPEEVRLDSRGTLTDFFLRRQYLTLKHAQSFEDLICLPTLEGVDAYVYQQETVRKVLRQFQGRALLADEVGLGKTIEACLVLKEYWQRGMVRRVLILTPPSLVSQWRSELEGKFGLPARVPDSAAFRANPEQFWREEPLVVASLALARRDSQAAFLAGVHWDLVIVDEAHALKNRASANWRLVIRCRSAFCSCLPQRRWKT
jgi:hypothetical protein